MPIYSDIRVQKNPKPWRVDTKERLIGRTQFHLRKAKIPKEQIYSILDEMESAVSYDSVLQIVRNYVTVEG